MRTVRHKTWNSFTVTAVGITLRYASRMNTRCNRTSQTAKRFAQTLIDVTEKNAPPIQAGNFHRGGRL
jgi:hypothetical protein